MESCWECVYVDTGYHDESPLWANAFLPFIPPSSSHCPSRRHHLCLLSLLTNPHLFDQCPGYFSFSIVESSVEDGHLWIRCVRLLHVLQSNLLTGALLAKGQHSLLFYHWNTLSFAVPLAFLLLFPFPLDQRRISLQLSCIPRSRSHTARDLAVALGQVMVPLKLSIRGSCILLWRCASLLSCPPFSHNGLLSAYLPAIHRLYRIILAKWVQALPNRHPHSMNFWL